MPTMDDGTKECLTAAFRETSFKRIRLPFKMLPDYTVFPYVKDFFWCLSKELVAASSIEHLTIRGILLWESRWRSCFRQPCDTDCWEYEM
mmetsp:Transcript_8762/g.16713  ORF Transcript_8762/g.16713 Transcript_8762/m.16713 type:complete len:90 (-) Transcript_8762:453-722(-)